ncbi:hypothetical protein P280DRAFT_466758 [Massarina eburnea CBS 473.64]|uniref:V-type c subunit family protein n=1 Tax=Massarina eburnea CBS 473.64 TaxID=1395130 RepID=A0A6A6S924_9PLEO|nr:hypothetical protein P280DRAFT_466758 [Massarina eburnea CBS 473.64]
MPPWVARQCHVLRGLKPASVRVCRRPHVSLRPYTQAPTGDDGNLKIRSANSAIIIPRSVVGTTPEDLIQHITPIGKGRLKYNRCAVFLVTPSFAPWLLDDSAFIQKAIHHTYSECLGPADPRYARVYALCAVVDKLPAPKPIHPAEDLGNEAASRSNQPPIGESGFEGMAYATLRYADWIASSFEPPDDQALISFVASTTSESVGYFADTLRLPLANTIFQTGSPSTMIDSLWVKNKGGQEFALKRKRSAKHHSIKIHAFAPGTRQASSLAVPLIPLTVPRRVEASMGNILRRVTGPDGESALASQELEQVVPQFYNARRESSQATMVWALVISKEKLKPILAATDSALGRLPDDIATGSMMTDAELWDSLWKKRPAAWNDLVPNALVAGARLHRVLSGGGGWGKKAGLLSLDPVASAPDTNSSASDMSDGPDNLSSALQQVARDGDYIQFFISPSNNIDDSVDPLQQLQEAAGLGSKWSWELGTIPSTVDALPAGSWQHNSSTTKETFVFRNCFGALTEGGVSINRNFELRRKEASPPIGGSKIDVPFSRFSSASLGPEGDIHDEDVGGLGESV